MNVDIVVISLRRATERRVLVERMFSTAQLSWRFFDAHTGLQHDGLSYDETSTIRVFGRPLTTPELGIWSSHVAVLDEHLKRGTSDYVLVMEDDVLYDTAFPAGEFTQFCADRDIHYVRLYAKQYAPAVVLGHFYDRHFLRFKTTPAGTQAYLMSKTGARAFIEAFRSIDQTVDLALDSFWRTRLPIYSIFPFPAIERYVPSHNLIPGHERLSSPTERLRRLQSRANSKARKIAANFALRKSDRRIRAADTGFRQVFEVP